MAEPKTPQAEAQTMTQDPQAPRPSSFPFLGPVPLAVNAAPASARAALDGARQPLLRRGSVKCKCHGLRAIAKTRNVEAQAAG